MCSYFFFLLPILFFPQKTGIRERFDFLDMATMKYDIPFLDRNTKFSLWQVKMRIMLMQMDLDDTLLGFNKMPSLWTLEEKQCKDQKALSQIHLHLSNQILHDVLKEKTDVALWLKFE